METFVPKKGTRHASSSDFGTIVWSNAQHEVQGRSHNVWTQIELGA